MGQARREAGSHGQETDKHGCQEPAAPTSQSLQLLVLQEQQRTGKQQSLVEQEESPEEECAQ